MTRRFGKSPIPDVRYVHRPGVYVILPREQKILLTYTEDPAPEFQLPGGGIEPGEQMLAALHREVLEETGWRISAPRRLCAYRRFTYMPEYDMHAEKLCIIYVANPVRQLCEPTEAAHYAVWTSCDFAVEEIGSEGDRAVLRDYLSQYGCR